MIDHDGSAPNAVSRQRHGSTMEEVQPRRMPSSALLSRSLVQTRALFKGKLKPLIKPLARGSSLGLLLTLGSPL